MNALELAAAQSRWAHRNVGEKIRLLGGLLLLAVTLPPFPFAPVIAIIAIVCAGLARVPWKLYAALVLAPAAFVVVGIAPLLVSLTADGLAWSPTGPIRAASVVARSIAGICCTMAFALTTPISELLAWLGKHGVSRSITYVAEVTYRMTGSLIATARAMNDAQARRLGHRTRRAMLHSMASQAANLFVVAFTRARRLQTGVEMRADPGAMQVLSASRPRDGAFVARSAVVLVLLVASWGMYAWGKSKGWVL